MIDLIEVKDEDGKMYLSIENNQNDDEKDRIGNTLEDFEFLQKLGTGGYGKVFKVISKLNKKIYAMKEIKLEGLGQKEMQ